MASDNPVQESDLWLAERLAEAAERLGEGVSAPLEHLESEHPSIAERLKNLLPSIEAMTKLALSRSLESLDVLEPPVLRTLGDFQILRVIGQGGMATVYEAIQVSLNRRVALKILPSLSAQDPLKLKRFQIEAQAAACLHHPHIVPVHLVESSHGVHYYAMRLIEGRTLLEVIDSSRRKHRIANQPGHEATPSAGSHDSLADTLVLDATVTQLDGDALASFRRAAELARQAAEALHFAHEQGILHRDVKPSNLMVDEAGCLFIVDFGLARIVGEADLTQTGALIGTLRYMSPEQASRTQAVVDHRADVYSLGAVLYEMITLRPLFDCEDRLELLDRIAVEDPTPPRRVNQAIPRDLETITLKATAKEPADRYATAQELAQDLDRFLHNQPIQARPPSLLDHASKWARRHGATVRLSLVVLTTAAVGLGIAVAWRYALLNRHYIELRSALDVAERSEAFTRRLWYDSQVRLAHQASDAGQVEFAQELLASLRRQTDGGDPRGFEWHYLWRLCHRDFSVLSRHDRPVDSVAIAPDGRTLATTDSDGMMILWDLVAGRERVRRRTHSRGCSGLEFSPDGTVIATWSSPGGIPSEVKIWGTAMRDDRQIVPGIAGYVTSVSFSYDGRELAIVEHPTDALDHPRTTIWSLTPAGTLVAPASPSLKASAFAFSCRGPRSASLGPDGVITLAWADRGENSRRRTRPLTGAARLVFSPDGHALAASGEGGISLFNADSGRELASFSTPSLGRLMFAGNGRWLADASARENHLTLIENPTTKPRLVEPLGSFPRNPRFSSSREGDLLALTGQGAAPALWDLAARGEPIRFPGTLSISSASAFAHDDKSLLLGGDDGRVRAWRFAQPPSVSDSFPAHAKEAWAVAFTPDGEKLISAGDDHNITLWNARDHRLLQTLKGHQALVAGLALNGDGSLVASAGFDKTVRLWSLSTGAPVAVLTGHTDRVRSVVFLERGTRAASAGSDGAIRIWDLKTGELLAVDRRHSDTIRALAADLGGRYLASAGDDRTIRVWDLRNDEKSFSVATPKQNSALAFSRDGARLAVGDDWGDITIWDTRNWTRLSTVKASDATIRGLAFTPGGRSLAAACDDGKIRLWDPITGQVTLVLEGRGGRVNAVAFSPDGLTLAAASHDGTVTLWRAGEP